MSIAKNARASQVMSDISNGKYTFVNKRGKFANFGSVITDTIFGQQAEADRRLKEIQAERARRLAKQKFA